GALETTSPAITGYVQDPDTPTKSSQVLLFIVNKKWKTFTANVNRPDLTTTLGSPNHGFSIPLSQLPAGVHRLDVYAVDSLDKSTHPIGTTTVSNNNPPTGAVESLTASGIVGYAVDPDTKKPLQIRYTIDDGAPVLVTANVKRPDLSPTFNTHGF